MAEEKARSNVVISAKNLVVDAVKGVGDILQAVINAVTGTLVTATFTQAMDPTTITPVGTFTLKETICLIMSALGCGVFVTGLVLLCMYLEGSAFNENG